MTDLFIVPKESDGQIRPRLSVPRTEIHAYQTLSDLRVGQKPMVPARGGGVSSVMWVGLFFAVALAMCVWVIAVCEELAKLQ